MKVWILLTAITTFLAVAADAPPKVTFVSHDKVNNAISKGGPLVAQPDLTVTGSHRDKPGQVEIHEKETDVIYIVDGDATFVTGGTVIGQRQTRSGQAVGTGVEGGEIHKLTKGDVIVVPAGIPHWFKEVPKTINYYVVKVLKP